MSAANGPEMDAQPCSHASQIAGAPETWLHFTALGNDWRHPEILFIANFFNDVAINSAKVTEDVGVTRSACRLQRQWCMNSPNHMWRSSTSSAPLARCLPCRLWRGKWRSCKTPRKKLCCLVLRAALK